MDASHACLVVLLGLNYRPLAVRRDADDVCTQIASASGHLHIPATVADTKVS